MLDFLIRRALQSLLLLLLVSVIAFLLLHLAPGGPLAQYAPSGDMSAEDAARVEHLLGFDRPLPVQYFEWLTRMLAGDWGRSYRDQQPVLQLIFMHVGATVQLMLASTLLAMLLGIWTGIITGIRRYGLIDTTFTVLSMIAISVPTFWLGFILIYVFAIQLEWLPAGDRFTIGDGSLHDYVIHMIAPVAVLTLVSTASWSRYMRSSVIDVMNQDFVRTARSKGLSERYILYRHIVRNALLPMITLAGLELRTIFSGALVTETVFTWPGIGRLFYESITYSDYPTVMGILVFASGTVVIGNAIADILYAKVDPRIRLS
ncbi:ABC transporter permease [Bradyrhizobium sp. BWA-3-5]|uniref:ABC transporter permease n=1 Tax=Bradyrhizobium sp. BWA-3-5 TaxID=3080013 RepID=UPI00293EFF18|nr:ABC transporter permease [Bradyrhizobium sp. BWA-3-5]WOH63710.1 ABC transporter permease [Bradyrhizobium sp. BWA-3-5]